MRWPLLTAVIIGLVLIQTSAAPTFEVLGVAPNLLLVALCAWAVVRPPRESMYLVPMAGIWVGLLSFQDMAVSVAAFAPVVVLAALRAQIATHSEFAWMLAVVIGATVLHFLALATSVVVEGSRLDWTDALTNVLMPSVMVNLLTALLVYWLVRLPTPRPQPRRRRVV